MAKAETSTTFIRIPVELKKKLEENRRPGQSYAGFIEELLSIGFAAGLVGKTYIQEAVDLFTGAKKRKELRYEKSVIMKAIEEPDSSVAKLLTQRVRALEKEHPETEIGKLIRAMAIEIAKEEMPDE